MYEITESLAARYESSDASVQRRVIFSSSPGTTFEWYDFFLTGSLAVQFASSVFSGVNPRAAFIFALLSFAAGFAVRPFGALVLGRIGDMVGRKYTFLVTISLMSLATFVIGLLPATLRLAWQRRWPLSVHKSTAAVRAFYFAA